MKKYNLTTEISSFNKFNSIVIFFILLLILFWNIYILYYFGIVLSIIGMLFVYMAFFRNSNKNKVIKFDEKYVYFDDNIILINDIVSIENGKIVYLINGSIENVSFEFNYLEANLYVLEKFWYKSQAAKKDSSGY